RGDITRRPLLASCLSTTFTATRIRKLCESMINSAVVTERMMPHAIASGTISFGLVAVPVKLYSATQSKSVSFNLLHRKDKSRLRQQYICATCGEVVERAEMVKGFEHAKDQYAVL